MANEKRRLLDRLLYMWVTPVEADAIEARLREIDDEELLVELEGEATDNGPDGPGPMPAACTVARAAHPGGRPG